MSISVRVFRAIRLRQTFFCLDFRGFFYILLAMRGLLAFSLVLGASISHASFEMMLMPDKAGKVHRIDPVSGSYLGSFNTISNAGGAFYQPWDGMMASVSGTNWLQVHNPNTGLTSGPLANFSIGESMTLATSSKTIYSTNLNSSSLFRAIQNLGGAWLAGSIGSTPSGMTSVRSTSVGTINGVPSIFFQGRNATNQRVVSSAPINGSDNYSSAPVSVVEPVGSNWLFAAPGSSSALLSRGASTAFAVCHMQGNAPFANVLSLHRFTSAGLIETSVVGLNLFAGQTASVVAGHDAFYVVGYGISGKLRVQTVYVDPSSVTSNLVGPAYEFSQVPIDGTQAGYFPSMVVAPEPGTLIALAAGIGTLARRRRNQSRK